MLNWAVVFFVLALISALFGFGGDASPVANVSLTLTSVFLLLFFAAVMAHAVRPGGEPSACINRVRWQAGELREDKTHTPPDDAKAADRQTERPSIA